MQQTEMLYLDYEAKRTNEILGISDERTDEIILIIANVSYEIMTNHQEYSFISQEKENAGFEGMHKGKILQRFLRGFTDMQERMMVFFLFEKLLDIMQERKTNELLNKIKENDNL